jgi:hypothetical protein
MRVMVSAESVRKTGDTNAGRDRFMNESIPPTAGARAQAYYPALVLTSKDAQVCDPRHIGYKFVRIFCTCRHNYFAMEDTGPLAQASPARPEDLRFYSPSVFTQGHDEMAWPRHSRQICCKT